MDLDYCKEMGGYVQRVYWHHKVPEEELSENDPPVQSNQLLAFECVAVIPPSVMLFFQRKMQQKIKQTVP